MSEEPQGVPVAGEPIGWIITDPDGNVIDSGPIVHAEPVFLVGEASDTEGVQE